MPTDSYTLPSPCWETFSFLPVGPLGCCLPGLCPHPGAVMLFQPHGSLHRCSQSTSEDPWTLEGAFCLWVPEPSWSLTHTAAGSGSPLEGCSGAHAWSSSRCSHDALSLGRASRHPERTLLNPELLDFGPVFSFHEHLCPYGDCGQSLQLHNRNQQLVSLKTLTCQAYLSPTTHSPFVKGPVHLELQSSIDACELIF